MDYDYCGSAADHQLRSHIHKDESDPNLSNSAATCEESMTHESQSPSASDHNNNILIANSAPMYVSQPRHHQNDHSVSYPMATTTPFIGLSIREHDALIRTAIHSTAQYEQQQYQINLPLKDLYLELPPYERKRKIESASLRFIFGTPRRAECLYGPTTTRLMLPPSIDERLKQLQINNHPYHNEYGWSVGHVFSDHHHYPFSFPSTHRFMITYVQDIYPYTMNETKKNEEYSAFDEIYILL
jgi:hypothetical protein